MQYAIGSTFVVLLGSTNATACDVPGVETFLHSGRLDHGEQVLERVLAEHPDDDRTRFGLGVLRVVRAVERFGQSLYEYGAKPGTTRLPIDPNPDPAPIDYRRFRRVLDEFRRDLAAAESTLAAVHDDDVTLSLRLADIRLDLDGDGRSTDEFLELLERGLRQRDFGFLQGNPEFLVRFDRGDVAWLRGYCHLVCGVLDGALAFDNHVSFDATAARLFANPVKTSRAKEGDELRIDDARFPTTEPLRLARMRRHFVAVCELNHETWSHVRREIDDDHEWLPNPRQHGVLGLPVDDRMITAWLTMVDEVQATLEGKRAFLRVWINRNDKGLDLKALLENPPTDWGTQTDFPPDRYFTIERDIDLMRVIGGFQAFGTTALGYAIWFN